MHTVTCKLGMHVVTHSLGTRIVFMYQGVMAGCKGKLTTVVYMCFIEFGSVIGPSTV